jgi:hypothetical protein
MRFHRVDGFAKVAVVAAVVLTVADVARATASLGGSGLVLDIVTLVHGVVLVGSWVAASLWLFMVRRNATTLVPDGVSAAPWVVLGWVVPIACFWIPKGIVDDSWEDTAKGCRDGSTAGSTSGWWALWVVYLVLFGVAGRVSLADGPERVLSVLFGLVALASVAAVAPWAKVVRDVTATQARLVTVRNT